MDLTPPPPPKRQHFNEELSIKVEMGKVHLDHLIEVMHGLESSQENVAKLLDLTATAYLVLVRMENELPKSVFQGAINHSKKFEELEIRQKEKTMQRINNIQQVDRTIDLSKK